MLWQWVVSGGLLAAVLLSVTLVVQPTEVQHQPRPLDAALATELQQLRQLLRAQVDAVTRQDTLLQQLWGQLGAATGETTETSTLVVNKGTPTMTGEPHAPAGARVRPHGQGAETSTSAMLKAELVAAERKALSRCTEADVPIIALLRQPCEDGWHGPGCRELWGGDDRFLPAPSQWLAEFNASMRAIVNCQRGFFDALAERLTLAHWEVEWDAQPFRIAATPPRTIGKMMHQLVTANYYHLTLSPATRPPLRRAPLPGWNYAQTTQPGFRWNVLDYGANNVFADPLATGRRCSESRAAWHCLWQRFPQQTPPRSTPPVDSAIGRAAYELYNISLSGERSRSILQYLVMAGVTQACAFPPSSPP